MERVTSDMESANDDRSLDSVESSRIRRVFDLLDGNGERPGEQARQLAVSDFKAIDRDLKRNLFFKFTRTFSDDDLSDICSEAYTKMHRYSQKTRFEYVENPRGLLWTIAKNFALDRIKSKKLPVISDPQIEPTDNGLSVGVPPVEPPEEEERRRLQDCIDQALNELASRNRATAANIQFLRDVVLEPMGPLVSREREKLRYLRQIIKDTMSRICPEHFEQIFGQA